jgi:hypothetical protein
MPKKKPSPRTSPTIGRSRSFSRVARNAGDCSRTCALIPSRSKMSRLARPDRRRHGVPAERVAVQERLGAGGERLEDPVAGDHRPERASSPTVMPLAQVMMSGT